MFQIQEFRSKLPDWARTSRFDIEARSEGNPTKDDMRLMMQSLLEERFQMVLHRETRDEPASAVVLAKPGVLGPRPKPHPADARLREDESRKVGRRGIPSCCCASASIVPETAGHFAVAGYNVTMDAIALALGGVENLRD
jgi:uncharacterized protein (TIGR03435 family)